MITIITGNINSQKTTKMIEHYKQHHQGDGFVSLKVMREEGVDHYDIMKLSNHQKKVLMIHEQQFNNHQDSSILIGPYHVIKESILWVEDEIKEMIKRKISPIYLDEIGMLELKNEGFHRILTEMIHSKLDLVLVIRDKFRQEVISKYHMEDIFLV